MSTCKVNVDKQSEQRETVAREEMREASALGRELVEGEEAVVAVGDAADTMEDAVAADEDADENLAAAANDPAAAEEQQQRPAGRKRSLQDFGFSLPERDPNRPTAPHEVVRNDLRRRRNDLLAPGMPSPFATNVGRKLAEDALKHGLKICGSQICSKGGVVPVVNFNKDKHALVDGLQAKCSSCNKNPVGVAEANAERKCIAGELTAVREHKASQSAVEDMARVLLFAALLARGVDSFAANEHRKADMGSRFASWAEGLWSPIQIKSDGVFKEDGTTPKPNNTSASHTNSGLASFQHCMGYDKNGYGEMLMIFIRTRFNPDTNEEEVRYWVCNGDDIAKSTLHELTCGDLTGGIKECSIDDIVARIANAPAKWRQTREVINLQVDHMNHRKEITAMMALKAAGFDVQFEPGNQTACDCFLDGAATQVKTLNLAVGKAGACHSKNGVANQPYTAEDGIEQMCVVMVIEWSGRFFLMYAIQPLHQLLLNGVFAHDGYHGKKPSSGKTVLSVPLQIFSRWLTGSSPQQKLDPKVKWLTGPAYGWRVPVEIKLGEHGIPPTWVKEAAQKVNDEWAFPSDGELRQHAQRIAKHIAQLQSRAAASEAGTSASHSAARHV